MSRLIAYEPPVFQSRRGGDNGVSFLCRACCLGKSAAGQRLLAAGTLQERQLRTLVHLVEVFGVAIRLQVNVGLVMRECRRLDGSLCTCSASFWKAS